MKTRLGALLTFVLVACDDASPPPASPPAGEKASSADAAKSAGKAEQAADEAAADESAAPSEDGAGAEPSAEARMFDKEIRKKSCELLTAAMVAEVAGIEESAIRQLTKSPCIYEWKGDRPGRASLGNIRTHKTVEAAQVFFDNGTRGMTGEEVAAGLQKVADEAKKDDPSGGAKTGAVAKKMGGALADGFTFEPVDGIGDKAMWNGTRREMEIGGKTIVDYDSQMSVLVGNMELTIAFEYDETEPKAYKDETTKLSKLVVEKLPAG